MDGARSLALQLALAAILCLPAACLARQSCTDASRTYGKLGLNPIEVPAAAVAGDHLKTCPQGLTCCTGQMEANLTRKARQWFDLRLVRITQASRDTLVTRTVKLNDFFLQLISRCESDLHEMFIRAYGVQYVQNVAVFRELFQNLRRFFHPGADANVTEAVRKFFVDIFERMFAMLNLEYTLDSSYLQCVTAQVGSLRPFGDIPDTLVRNIKQAFVAAKMFVQGLAVGRDIALKAPTVEPSAACFRALTKMLYCQHCRADTGAGLGAAPTAEVRPCREYCLNVARGCLAQHYELSDSWDRYLDAMDELGSRLEGAGAFNIEAVLTPLKDLISTAIMEYHDNNKDVTQKVFTSKACGAPKAQGRVPRAMPPSHNAVRSGSSNGEVELSQPPLMRSIRSSGASAAGGRASGSKQQQQHQQQQSSVLTLDRLVRDARTRLKQLRGMWRTAADSLCSDGDVMAQPQSARCWNGYEVARYLVPPTGDGIAGNANNPDVRVVASEGRQNLGNLTDQLKLVTNRIRDAMQGIDVDWLVLEIPQKDGSSVQVDGSSSPLDSDDSDDDDDGSGSSRRTAAPAAAAAADGSGDDGAAAGAAWRGIQSLPSLPTSSRTPSNGDDGEQGSGQQRVSNAVHQRQQPQPTRDPVQPRQRLDAGEHADADDDDDGSGSGSLLLTTAAAKPKVTAQQPKPAPADNDNDVPPQQLPEQPVPGSTGERRTNGNQLAAVRAGNAAAAAKATAYGGGAALACLVALMAA